MILSAEIQQLRKGVARRLCRSGRGGTVHQLQLYCRAQTSADRLEDGVAHVLSTDHRTGEGVDQVQRQHGTFQNTFTHGRVVQDGISTRPYDGA